MTKLVCSVLHTPRSVWLAVAGAVLLLSSTVNTADAQVLYGSVVGNVTDTSGSGIPSAAIKITQIETNETREIATNPTGQYTLSTVPAGTYRIEIRANGFRPHVAENVVVRLNTVVRVDATLQVGQMTEAVSVTAQAAALKTDRADVSAEFTTKSLVELPQPTRNYQGVLALMPGIAPPSASSGGTNNPGKSMQISANGTSRSGTAVRIDGVTATNPWVQFYSTYVPSNESIETVNVVTASPDAEQGLVNGAAINVQTKSGSNSLHGSLFEYNVNSAFKARPIFPRGNTSNPKLIENDLGGSLGGRIIRDKLFYFVSYEGDLIRQSAPGSYTLPTDMMRGGNLSASPTPIYDPSTGNADGSGRTPFLNNIIPSSSISPIAAKVISLMPATNLGGETNNFYAAMPLSNSLHRLDTKVDWNTSSRLRVTGRFGYQPYDITQQPPFGDILAGPVAYSASGNVIATAVSATYTVSPTFVLDGTWGLTRPNQVLAVPSNDQRIASDLLGIPGTNLGDLPLAGGMPQFVFGSGYTTLGYSYPYLHYVDPIFQYTANATWIKGSHNLRFGFDINRQHMNHQEVQPTQFNFMGGVTSVVGGPASNQYNAFADFLLALPYRYQNSRQTTPWVTLRTWQDSLYFRDQWQVNRKLTLTYGTRWEFFPVPTRADRGIELFDTNTRQILICGVAGNPMDCGIQVSKLQFSPRLGLAFRPTETFVIRAGFSLNPEQINMYRDGMYSYPTRYDYVQTGSSTYLPVASLASGVPVQPAVDISSGRVGLPAGASYEEQGAVLPKKFIRGYTESWNFSIQKELGHGWNAQAGYVGTHTLHQHTRANINYGQVSGGAASQPYSGYGITGALRMILPIEAMSYNALQLSMQRRFGNGFSMQAAYTRSKWMGLCCDDSGDGGLAIPIPEYLPLNRSLMGGDRPNNLQISTLYELPFGSGKPFVNHGVMSKIIGGWQINGIFSYYSGSPFSVGDSGTKLNAPGSTQRADQVKNEVAIYGSPDLYFDTTAFASVPIARFGTAGFNSLRGPDVRNLDLGIFRSFRITERVGIQFRGEALNATNTPHFANPSSNVTSSNFGQITGTSAPSRLTDERFIRLGLRLSF